MKKITVIFIAVLVYCTAFAIPAWRGLIKYTQPDGTVVTLQKHGDEFYHWTTNASGQVVEKDADGFWRPVSSSTMNARRMAAKAKRAAYRSVFKTKDHIAVGQKHFLVILVEFSDVAFSSATANEDFTNQLNQHGYSDVGATGSARDYYYENSHGYFEPIFDVYGPIKVSKTMAYYGGNDKYGDDKAPEEAVVEGCKGLDEQIDFSQYDNDGDGKVDLVFMYYAGYGEADYDDENTIWPHKWNLSYAGSSLELDGKTIDSYACANELEGSGNYAGKMCGIGGVCHEFGHAMGLPDFYDTDYETNGQAAGMMDYSLMDGGSYNNNSRTPPYLTTEEKILLGWLDEDSIQLLPEGPVVIPSVIENVAYKTLTDTEGEYFVYECRGSNGWDAYLPAQGLFVTHVDKSSRQVKLSDATVTASYLWDNWAVYNSINENGDHPCCYLVSAADQSNLMFGFEYYDGYGYYFNGKYAPQIPFPGSEEVTSYVARSWNGVDSEITLSGIAYADNQVSLTAKYPKEEIDYAVIANPGNGVYAVGDSFALSLVEPDDSPVAAVSWYFDDEPVAGPTVPLKAGQHTVEAVLTLTSGGSQVVTLEITVE